MLPHSATSRQQIAFFLLFFSVLSSRGWALESASFSPLKDFTTQERKHPGWRLKSRLKKKMALGSFSRSIRKCIYIWHLLNTFSFVCSLRTFCCSCSRYGADSTGQPDYATALAGGNVVKAMTSDTFKPKVSSTAVAGEEGG